MKMPSLANRLNLKRTSNEASGGGGDNEFEMYEGSGMRFRPV